MSGASIRRYLVRPARAVHGTLTVPGDKAISHRALMLGGIADRRTDINGFLASEDCMATPAVLEAHAMLVERPAETAVRVFGVGRDGLCAAQEKLDMGNAGPAMRLFMGLLAGQ